MNPSQLSLKHAFLIGADGNPIPLEKT